jgi:cell division protease FtsH
MAKQISFSEKELNEKKQVLKKAAQQLKKEFIGIDSVINRLIETISCWYVFPDMQERPVIVNLWGMTGVGKTSLVRRLAELLNFENKFYHFDLGVNSDSASSIEKHLKSLFSFSDGKPAIIALDEFQHARTLNEEGNEIDKYYSRIIWELLDSGKFQSARQDSYIGSLYKVLEKVKFFVAHGVKVSRGKITEKADFFREIIAMGNNTNGGMGSNYFLFDDFDLDDYPVEKKEKNKDPLWFLPQNTTNMLFDLSDGMFSSSFELTKHLLSLDETGILHFLEKILDYANSRKVVDCSKSLIIVMGNLDEAYTISGNFNPDMNADEFYEMSLRIMLPDIKNALVCRFRHEQIARLGNNHIIYPAFSQKVYEQLILSELNKIALQVKEKFGWIMTFTEAMRSLIYREGVFPTQGTRPLFSTIQQLVHSRIAQITYEAVVRQLQPDTVQLHFENERIVIRYYQKGKLLHSFEEKPELNLEKLRKPKRGDAQALTAVHESGHAVLSLMLMKTVPECIFSETVHQDAAGYTMIKSLRDFLARRDVIRQIAVYLGGIVAEEIVFGENHIATGSEDDLCKATSLATAAIKKYGMGNLAASIQVKAPAKNHFIHDTHDKYNAQAEQLLKEARGMAARCLQENKVLLLRMADYLCEERMMPKETILHFVQQYAPAAAIHFIKNMDQIYYRKHLKEQVATLDTTVKADRSLLLSLNKQQVKAHNEMR